MAYRASGLIMRRLRVPLLGSVMVLILGACPATHAISGKDPLTRPMPTTPGDALPEGAGSPRQEVPQAWLRAICDRVEDCTVERNEALTRSYSGTEEDLRLSRLEARGPGSRGGAQVVRAAGGSNAPFQSGASPPLSEPAPELRRLLPVRQLLGPHGPKPSGSPALETLVPPKGSPEKKRPKGRSHPGAQGDGRRNYRFNSCARRTGARFISVCCKLFYFIVVLCVKYLLWRNIPFRTEL